MRDDRDTPRERAYRLTTGSSSASTVMVSFCFIATGASNSSILLQAYLCNAQPVDCDAILVLYAALDATEVGYVADVLALFDQQVAEHIGERVFRPARVRPQGEV